MKPGPLPATRAAPRSESSEPEQAWNLRSVVDAFAWKLMKACCSELVGSIADVMSLGNREKDLPGWQLSLGVGHDLVCTTKSTGSWSGLALWRIHAGNQP